MTVPDFSAAQLIAILQNIGNWIFLAGVLLVPVMIIIGAAFFLSGGGDPARIAAAKKIFLWTGIGLALILLARGVFMVLRSVVGG